MRALKATAATLAGAAAVSGALWFANAAYPGGPYQIYIFDSGDRQSTYAIEEGARAAGALVENCVGRLLDDPAAVVARLRERAAARDEALSLIHVSGEGSRVQLGRCEDKTREKDGWDSLVIVRDAGARQTRRLIREIPGLAAADREKMEQALGL